MRGTLIVHGEGDFMWVRSNIQGRNVQEILDKVVPTLDKAPIEVNDWTSMEVKIER